MKNLFDKQPISSEAPRGLRNKVEIMARQKPRKQWFGPRMRWAAVGTAVAAASIGGVMFMMPANAEAKTWDMVTTAYGQVRGLLIQMEVNGDGEKSSILIAGKDNDWRVSVSENGSAPGEKVDISYSNGELTIWDGGDTAQVMNLGINIPFTPEQVMKGLSEELSATKLFEEHADEIGRNNIRIEQPTKVKGRNVYNVYINEEEGGGRVHVLVDADTDLPISMTVSDIDGVNMKMSFQFDADFDSSLLRPVLPTGVKFNHIDQSMMMGDGDHSEMLKGLEDLGRSFGGDHKQKKEDGIEITRHTVKIEKAAS